MTKEELRREVARTLAALPEDYCRQADRAICRHVTQSPLFRQASTVFCYVGTAREIDTRPILQAALAAGKVLAVPLCTGKGIMEARRIRSLEELAPGQYGIMEPVPGCPVVPPEELELALVPCCTGNADGQRLGYGGGFYDRYLPRTTCPAVLLCRGQLLRQHIPSEDHDRAMDYLVTEAGVIAVSI